MPLYWNIFVDKKGLFQLELLIASINILDATETKYMKFKMVIQFSPLCNQTLTYMFNMAYFKTTRTITHIYYWISGHISTPYVVTLATIVKSNITPRPWIHFCYSLFLQSCLLIVVEESYIYQGSNKFPMQVLTTNRLSRIVIEQ